MKIGVDATTWWNGRGFGRFTRHLLQAMFADKDHEFVLFVDHPPVGEMFRDNVRPVQIETSAPVTARAVSDNNRSLGDIAKYRASVRQERPDVMYFPAVYSWFPVGPGIPTVVTFHDAIAERFPQLVLPHLKGRWLWNLKTFAAKHTATRLTTVSHSAAAEIAQYLRVPTSRLAVIHEAADRCFAPVASLDKRRSLRRRIGLAADRRFILYVGGVAPHKNLESLVRALALIGTSAGLEDLDLVFTGDPSGSGFLSSHGSLLSCIDNHPSIRHRVHFTGFIEDDELPTLYSDALATAMPAFSEGFGLPALEGLACGTPVIATAGGAVEEIAGPAGLYFDPNSISSIAAAMWSIGSDQALLDKLRGECAGRASQYNWTDAGNAMIEVIKTASKAS